MADQDTNAPSEAEKLDEELEKDPSKTEEDSGQSQNDDNKEESKMDSTEQETDKRTTQDQLESQQQTSTEDTEEEIDEPATEPKSTDSTSPGESKSKWYVVHTYAGHENKVATGLKQRIESEHLEDKILDILVPTQDKIEIRGGKKETVKEKIFPGYILVKMVLDDNSWLAVRTTQGVTSFVGMGNKPTPISEAEVKSIVQYMSQGAPATFKEVFLPDDTVKIIDGPFADFIGKVDTVDKEKGKVRVLVSIFGRETPVELDFLQIQKL